MRLTTIDPSPHSFGLRVKGPSWACFVMVQVGDRRARSLGISWTAGQHRSFHASSEWCFTFTLGKDNRIRAEIVARSTRAGNRHCPGFEGQRRRSPFGFPVFRPSPSERCPSLAPWRLNSRSLCFQVVDMSKGPHTACFRRLYVRFFDGSRAVTWLTGETLRVADVAGCRVAA